MRTGPYGLFNRTENINSGFIKWLKPKPTLWRLLVWMTHTSPNYSLINQVQNRFYKMTLVTVLLTLNMFCLQFKFLRYSELNLRSTSLDDQDLFDQPWTCSTRYITVFSRLSPILKWGASSRWLSSLYRLMRKSVELTIGKMHPTLVS